MTGSEQIPPGGRAVRAPRRPRATTFRRLLRFDSVPLGARLALLIGLLVCALAGPLLVLLPARMEALSRGWAESRSVAIARLLAAASEAALDFDDPVAAEALLSKLGSTRGAISAALLRADGSALARWRDSPAVSVADRPRPADRHVMYGRDLITVQVPVEARSGKVGTLVLAFDLVELRTRMDEAYAWLATATAAMLLAGIAAALLIGAFVARPLRHITRVAERIAEGDPAAAGDLEIDRRDESGALARAFEQMLARLQEKRAALAGAYGELTNKLADLKRTQEQLVAADRRISVGRLAAGVAHEVNNPLAYVSANLRFVSRTLPHLASALAAEGESGAKAVEEMASAVAEAAQGTERIRLIVRSLKSFSRDDEDRRQRLELSGPLEAAIAMGAHEVKQRAKIVREYGPVPQVEANEVRLSQVFLNLLINAAQAIPEGDVEQPHSVTVVTRTAPDGRAVVEVKDTGSGIRPEDLPRLFQPFFTTKAAGVGTGLGLSISQGIVEGLGGRMEVESELGRGSTFRVILPAAAGATAPAPLPVPVPAATPAPALTRGKLLVVDDEPIVCRALARSLRAEFDVETFSSASRALERIEQQRFEHILCDVMMPDMSGPAFQAELALRHPDVARRVIFMTGGTFTPETQMFLSRWEGGLLEKPLDFDRLRKLIHDTPAVSLQPMVDRGQPAADGRM